MNALQYSKKTFKKMTTVSASNKRRSAVGGRPSAVSRLPSSVVFKATVQE